jgi:hypothetical protein
MFRTRVTAQNFRALIFKIIIATMFFFLDGRNVKNSEMGWSLVARCLYETCLEVQSVC